MGANWSTTLRSIKAWCNTDERKRLFIQQVCRQEFIFLDDDGDPAITCESLFNTFLSPDILSGALRDAKKREKQ